MKRIAAFSTAQIPRQTANQRVIIHGKKATANPNTAYETAVDTGTRFLCPWPIGIFRRATTAAENRNSGTSQIKSFHTFSG